MSEATSGPATGTTAPTAKKRRRRWPWVLLALLVIIVLALWFGFNAFGADWIATNGKDPAPIGSCPYTNCTDVTYTTDLGAWYAPATSGHPTVVIVHGYGANRSDHTQVGLQLQHLGYGILALDLGYEGNNTADDHDYGGGGREADDVKAAVGYLDAHGVGTIVLLGYSAGGTESILAAGDGAHVAAIVADSSPVSFVHLATDRLGVPTWLFAPSSLMYGWFSSGGSLGSLSGLSSSYHTPTLVIQGSADKTVDPSNGPAIVTLTHGTLWAVPGVGHTATSQHCPQAYVTQLDTFFSDAVNGSPFQISQAC